MRRLSLITALVLIAFGCGKGVGPNSKVDKDVHNLCLKAQDYAGCVKLQSVKLDQPKAVGNSCPIGYAYVGQNACLEVTCDRGGFRTLASGHDPRLGGKGWACRPRWDTSGGSLNFGGAIDSKELAFDERCPSIEPQVGRNNSCQNGLEEKEIKGSEYPVGMGIGKL